MQILLECFAKVQDGLLDGIMALPLFQPPLSWRQDTFQLINITCNYYESQVLSEASQEASSFGGKKLCH